MVYCGSSSLKEYIDCTLAKNSSQGGIDNSSKKWLLLAEIGSQGGVGNIQWLYMVRRSYPGNY